MVAFSRVHVLSAACTLKEISMALIEDYSTMPTGSRLGGQNVGTRREKCTGIGICIQTTRMTLSKPSHHANLSADSHHETQKQACFISFITPSSYKKVRLISVPFVYVLRLQLRLVLGHGSAHHVPDIAGGLVQEEGHALAAEVLADDVELNGVFVDHVGDSAEEQKSVKDISKCAREGKTYPQPSSTTWDQP
jgi:hypothetical protein